MRNREKDLKDKERSTDGYIEIPVFNLIADSEYYESWNLTMNQLYKLKKHQIHLTIF
jgi:hypothetical protein